MTTPDVGHPAILPVRHEWLGLVREAALEPDLPIVDPHHHLFRLARDSYLGGELADDIRDGGHRVAASVHVDARLDYFMEGPEALRPVGETISVLRQAREFSTLGMQLCLGLVGSAVGELGRRPNVYCKLGGLAKWLTGSDFHLRPAPPSSQDLVTAWGPIFDVCLDAFGPGRCMFESNFPMEKATCSYGVLWNAFKRYSAGMSASERADLLAGTAARAYRLDLD